MFEWWVETQIKSVLAKLVVIIGNQEKMMATLDDILAAVTSEGAAITALQGLIATLQADLKAAMGSGASQAEIDQIFAAVQSDAAAIAAAADAAKVTPAAPSAG